MFAFLEKLHASDKQARYDKQALAILSQKKLMAKLLKEVVPEVKNYSVEEIETFIEGTPKVSKIGVHPIFQLRKLKKFFVVDTFQKSSQIMSESFLFSQKMHKKYLIFLECVV